MMDARGQVSLWSLTTGECLEENSAQFEFSSLVNNYLQKATRAHSAVKYNDDGHLLRVGKGFSIWSGSKVEDLCQGSEPIPSTLTTVSFNSHLQNLRSCAPSYGRNVEFVHPTMNCLFPFVEYNRQLDEVYLYREARIAPIFEWEPYKLDEAKDSD